MTGLQLQRESGTGETSFQNSQKSAKAPSHLNTLFIQHSDIWEWKLLPVNEEKNKH